MNPQTISGLDANGDIVITCNPSPGASQGTQQEVSCSSDGHGALFTTVCQGTGPGNAVSGSVTFTIEDQCGSGLDPNNANTFNFTNLVPGAP
jgi:hypothetical protein